MALDRDELAARCYLAIITPFEGCAPVEDFDYEVLSDTATKAADALLSRLAPAPSPSLAPSPSPAASPAPYVPRVGDVVGIDGVAEYGETRVVTKIDGDVFYVRLNTSGEMICRHAMDLSMLTYLRPATPAERAAAGLPVDEAPVSDGEACIAWLKSEGWSVSSNAIAAWNEATRRARVAAKGGVA